MTSNYRMLDLSIRYRGLAPDYRNRCVDRLIEIIFDIDDYKGSRRLFIP